MKHVTALSTEFWNCTLAAIESTERTYRKVISVKQKMVGEIRCLYKSFNNCFLYYI